MNNAWVVERKEDGEWVFIPMALNETLDEAAEIMEIFMAKYPDEEYRIATYRRLHPVSTEEATTKDEC